MTDPRQQPILIDSLKLDSGGKVFGPNFAGGTMQPFDVTVELDGVAIGSAPGEFKATPGLHKLRLSREDFQDWTRTVNIYNGQSLRVALNMSIAGYERWKDTFDFLVSLESNRKLTDAEVKRVEGLAKMLSNSHFNVDHAKEINITEQKVIGPGASASIDSAPSPVYVAPQSSPSGSDSKSDEKSKSTKDSEPDNSQKKTGPGDLFGNHKKVF
jgi:hypothetical protein